MPGDSFREVATTSWFSRIGSAFKGILIGLILFVVSFPLLFWNEGRSVQRYKTLKEGSQLVVSVASDRVDPANEGKLVHVTGRADTAEVVADPVFGVSANALKLRRRVEMFQWEEKSESTTKEKVGGGTETVTTYTYGKTWATDRIRSADFKNPAGHQNPDSMPFESDSFMADVITLGAFTLSPELAGSINNFEPLPAGDIESLPESIKSKAKLHNTGYYIGADPTAPQVGDLRVTFEIAPATDVSVIAQQAGDSFGAYTTKAGGSLMLLHMGIRTAGDMIQSEVESNKMLTWILRLVGFILMFVGLNLIVKPLSVIADVLPFLGTIVEAGTGIISFLVAAVLSTTTIAIAWIVYRPLLGIALLAVTLGLVFALRGKLKKAKAATASA